MAPTPALISTTGPVPVPQDEVAARRGDVQHVPDLHAVVQVPARAPSRLTLIRYPCSSGTVDSE